MARVEGASGTGTFGQAAVIGSDGVVRAYKHPRDPQTPQQLYFRQLMRGLYRVLPEFSTAVDNELIAVLQTASWWSSQTFAQWAQQHGEAILEDVSRYGLPIWPESPTSDLLDDFNRSDGPAGENWHGSGQSWGRHS